MKNRIKGFTDKMLGGIASGIMLGAVIFGIVLFLLNQIIPGGLWPPRKEEPSTGPDFETHLYEDGDMRISAYNGYRINESITEERGQNYILVTIILEKEPET